VATKEQLVLDAENGRFERSLKLSDGRWPRLSRMLPAGHDEADRPAAQSRKGIPAAGLAFMLLLFPTGRLRSRRWRPAVWFVAAVFTLDAAAQVARACRVWADPFTAPSDGWYRGSHTAVLIMVPAALGGPAVQPGPV
jgi:hypothetical protein